MKLFLSTFALLSLSIGSAALASSAGANSPRDLLSSTTSLKPVRNAKVHAQVFKAYKKKMADGSYEPTAEKVCDITGEVPVYDDAQSGGIVVGDDGGLICKTNLNAGPANIIITGAVAILHNVDPLDEGVKQDYRQYGESVWIQMGSQVKVVPFATAMVPDLNVKSMVMTAYGDQFGGDQPGGAVTDEAISVNVKFEDK